MAHPKSLPLVNSRDNLVNNNSNNPLPRVSSHLQHSSLQPPCDSTEMADELC